VHPGRDVVDDGDVDMSRLFVLRRPRATAPADEAMVEARALDLEEARRWVVEMVGEDARAEKLSALSR